MKYSYLLLSLIGTVVTLSAQDLELEELHDTVEIIRDQWGVNHIYASNEHDLFFAQGYAAAKDRLFQFEIWRRQASGTSAEILGERAFKRDLGTRLFKFRGDMIEEMNHYHPRGVEIITAFTNGVNAYIEEALKQKDQLPIEFKMLNILPQKWTPEIVISRHQGLLGNIGQELQTARAVAAVGAEKVKELSYFHPKDPDLTLPDDLTQEMLEAPILELYNAFRRPLTFLAEDIDPSYRIEAPVKLALNESKALEDPYSIGSNNWVLDGSKTASRGTLMANDPHRTVATPSLRYMAHLVAPGWNVIGGGEPEIPGISIGHNEYGAWGLTVFRTDGEDLYVYDIDPENPNRYKYQEGWEDFIIIKDSISVKGEEDRMVELKYSRHGPVTYIDTIHHKAYAVRSAWLEVGGAPYLASLRMNQAKDWAEFKMACHYSHIPGENMIWADKNGNIGWQSVGIAPVREHFSGMVPVKGDGSFEWNGYLPIIEKPSAYNPSSGFIATANQNVTPENYPHYNAIGYSWSDPYRGDRIDKVLNDNKNFSMSEMMALQTDYYSLPAQRLLPFLKNAAHAKKEARILGLLEGWNNELSPNSIQAAIYVSFENELRRTAAEQFIPKEAKPYMSSIQLARIIQWVENPTMVFEKQSKKKRDQWVKAAFKRGIKKLEERLGEDPSNWTYGQANNKHISITHALGNLVKAPYAELLNLPALPRGGNSYTPGSTGNNLNQSSGATFRIIVDTSDWDSAVATNSPGQSGDPESPFYRNLYESWAEDSFFPVYFSKEKILENADSRVIIRSAKE